MTKQIIIISVFLMLITSLSEGEMEKTKIDRNKPYALTSTTGSISLYKNENVFGNIEINIHGLSWNSNSQSSATISKDQNPKDGEFFGYITIPSTDGKRMLFNESINNIRENGFDIYYKLYFPDSVHLNGYQVSFTFDIDWIKRKTLTLVGDETKSIRIPAEYESMALGNSRISEIGIAEGEIENLVIKVDKPSSVLIQDNRAFGSNNIELRFNFHEAGIGGEVSAETLTERRFSLTYSQPIPLILDEDSTTDWTDTSDWFPFVLPYDDAPIDISFLNEKPAGKHGFLTTKGDQFVFEDGTPIRFWGTCFSASANFPTHEQSEYIAKRLAKFGVNIVRTHHADAGWSAPNLFEFDWDNQKDNTLSFDPESMDRYDYLIYCLKQEGIYIYLDQLVHRKFKEGDGVDAVDQLDFAAKPYNNFDPKLIELQKKFSHDLWTHVNPYTKLAYKDDPAVVLMEFANENDLFSQKITIEPYRSRLEEKYRKWAKENGIEVSQEPVDFTNFTEPIIKFLHKVQRDYYVEMGNYLRSIGVKVPMSGSNWSQNLALLSSLLVNDYTDSHSYWDHPNGDKFRNKPMVAEKGNVFAWLSFNRAYGKPFFVSEWDQPWANEWRAEHPLAMSAIASFQGWNGLTVYTYRHSTTTPIGYISGAFETFNDPARFGLFYHSALIFRRGDVATSDQTIALHVPKNDILKSPNPNAWQSQSLLASAEKYRIAMALSEVGANMQPYDQPLIDGNASDVTSDTGQLYRSWKDRIGKIDSPMTKAVYGFVGDIGSIKLDGLNLDVKTPFATIALSSLTDKPIEQSDKLLLTAVGRAENTGFQYNAIRTKILNRGNEPILVEPIKATIEIKTSIQDLKVWAISADGKDKVQIPSKMENNKLIFNIDKQAKTIYYIISS